MWTVSCKPQSLLYCRSRLPLPAESAQGDIDRSGSCPARLALVLQAGPPCLVAPQVEGHSVQHGKAVRAVVNLLSLRRARLYLTRCY